MKKLLGLTAAVLLAGVTSASAAPLTPPATWSAIGESAADWKLVSPVCFGTSGGCLNYFTTGGTVEFELKSAAWFHTFGTTDNNGNDLTLSGKVFDDSTDAVGTVKTFVPVSNPFRFYFQNNACNDCNHLGLEFALSSGYASDSKLGMEVYQSKSYAGKFLLFFDDGGGQKSSTEKKKDWVSDDDDFNDMVIQVTAQPVPEPTSMFLLGTGLMGLASRMRRRK